MDSAQSTPNPQNNKTKKKQDEPQTEPTPNKPSTPDDTSKETPGAPSTDLIVNNFVLLNQIGRGAFGEIFLSFNLRDNIEVAVKRELKRIGKSVQLKVEAKV